MPTRRLRSFMPKAVAALRTWWPARPPRPRSRVVQAAPAVLLVTGASAALWWWTQWARGRAESEASESQTTAVGDDAASDG